jgi:uncharacterized alkaline shock family protein YloU
MEESAKAEKLDRREFDFPETHYLSNIDNKVFQNIVANAVQEIEGVSLYGGKLFGQLLLRERRENARSIRISQNEASHSVEVIVEVTIAYGLSIPTVAEELQNKIAERIIEMTGLHVSSIEVIFRDIVSRDKIATIEDLAANEEERIRSAEGFSEDEYSDDF